MSWVSEIWSTSPISVDGRLAAGWDQDGPQHATYHGHGWLITIEPLREQDWFDRDRGQVPLPVARVLPQARACLLVNLEPLGAPKAAYRFFAETVAALMLGQEAVCWDQDEVAVTRAQLSDREGIQER